jgi:hypothetical protein
MSRLGFSVEISRQRSAGQEREAEDQPAPFVNGIFDTHTQVCRGLETRVQRRYLPASGGSDEKTFLRWLRVLSPSLHPVIRLRRNAKYRPRDES